MMNSRGLFLVLATLGWSSPVLADVVIDFESLAFSSPESKLVAAPYLEDGFELTSTSEPSLAFFNWATTSTNYAGSTGLANSFLRSSTILRKVGGGTFDLLAIDLSALYRDDQEAVSVIFRGTRADASIVDQTIALGPDFGFATYALNGFTNVVSVSWSRGTGNHQFDDVRIAGNAVPEPSTFVLLLAGTLPTAVAARLRRRRRSAV